MIDRRNLTIGVLLIVLAAVSWWYGRNPSMPLGIDSAKLRHDPDYIVERFAATAMNEKGTPRYQLSAERMTHYPDDDTSHFVRPVLVQFQPAGLQVTTRSDYGVMPGDGSEILMTGNVRATRSGDAASAGGEMRTDRLRIELDR